MGIPVLDLVDVPCKILCTLLGIFLDVEIDSILYLLVFMPL